MAGTLSGLVATATSDVIKSLLGDVSGCSVLVAVSSTYELRVDSLICSLVCRVLAGAVAPVVAMATCDVIVGVVCTVVD